MAKKSGTYYINQAQKHGLTVKNGKGDHYKVYAPGGNMMVIPSNLKGNGTEHSIIKWFLKLGIIVILAYGLLAFVF